MRREISNLFLAFWLTPCDVLCSLFKVYSASIYLVLSGEGFREGVQPSLSPIVQIYGAIKSSFVTYFSDREAIADGLNPLTISHIAITISCRPMGRAKITWVVEKGMMRPNRSKKVTAIHNMAAKRPHPDIHRGMSFD